MQAVFGSDREWRHAKQLVFLVGISSLVGCLGLSDWMIIDSLSDILFVCALMCFDGDGQIYHASSQIVHCLSGLVFWNKAWISLTASNIFSSEHENETAHVAADKDITYRRSISLTTNDSFLSHDVVSAMTLRDVADVFFYASRINQKSFDREDFFRKSAQRKAAKHAIHLLDCATLCSRGPSTELFIVEEGSSGDSMDALIFCGALRIFAEWRNIRTCPNGYPTYSIGLKMARKDLIQNLNKVELAVHRMMDLRRQEEMSEPGKVQRACPTLRQLLEHEVKTKVHRKLPKVSEHSAGSGILWSQRQIAYQNAIFDNNSRVPFEFPTPKAAFFAAYHAVYSEYSSFLTRTTVMSTLSSVPTLQVLLRQMNAPYREDEAHSPSSNEEITRRQQGPLPWRELCIDKDQESLSEKDASSEISPIPRMNSFGQDSSNELEFGERIAELASALFGRCVPRRDDEEQHSSSRNALCRVPSSIATSTSTSSEWNDIPYFLSVLRPLENDWHDLIAELNMDDPSRV